MPTYQYYCDACQHEMEVLQKITENPLKKCPKCSLESLKRGPGGGIGVAFKGSGFYINDYRASKEPSTQSDDSKKASSCACKGGSHSCT